MLPPFWKPESKYFFRNPGIFSEPAYDMQLIGRLWTLLAPEIVHAILAGTLQKSILINKLSKTMPERRVDQKKLFGFE